MAVACRSKPVVSSARKMLVNSEASALDRRPGIDLYALMGEMFPINRSLTGAGVRQTLGIVARYIGLAIHEVETGTAVIDWHVPMEWNIRSGTIKTLDGRCLVDFARHNLHVMGYSKPVNGMFSRAELARHVHTLPDQPDLIPYRTGYYADDWGFCLPDKLWQGMTDEAYRVEIDSVLSPGSMTYGEFFVPGETRGEVLITCHVCHPSLANDNLSGIAIATFLAQELADRDLRYSYRFVFAPGTIGAIAWLAQNRVRVDRIAHGLILTGIGDRGGFHYKRSRRGDAEI